MKYVTIATDISRDIRSRTTTWACYIRHSGGTIKEVHEFKKFYYDTSKAETYALVNALIIAKQQIPDWDQSKIIIHNEIEHVLRPIKTKAGNIRQRDAERTEAIRGIALPILSQAYEWERRKIKAHYADWRKSENPAKYALNRWCDEQSRALMWKIREKKLQEKTID